MKNAETGKRAARINPPEDWIIAPVPELRIVDEELWRAAKPRREEIARKYATAISATRKAHANRMNATHRPRYLMSGLLEYGVCGGPFAMRGQDRYCCSNHVMTGACANGRGIRRVEIEERVMAGLKDELMAPEAAAAEAMQSYAEETKRFKRTRRAAGAADRRKLADIGKKIRTTIAAIEEGGYVRGMSDPLRELEAHQDELNEGLFAGPTVLSVIHPHIAVVHRRKVERLAGALADPRDRDGAATAIRRLIERIMLTPGEKRGEIHAALQRDLGNILAWVGDGTGKGATDTPHRGMTVSVVAGAGFEPATFRL